MPFFYLCNDFPSFFSLKTKTKTKKPCLYPEIGTQSGFLPESVHPDCNSVISDRHWLPLILAFYSSVDTLVEFSLDIYNIFKLLIYTSAYPTHVGT